VRILVVVVAVFAVLHGNAQADDHCVEASRDLVLRLYRDGLLSSLDNQPPVTSRRVDHRDGAILVSQYPGINVSLASGTCALDEFRVQDEIPQSCVATCTEGSTAEVAPIEERQAQCITVTSDRAEETALRFMEILAGGYLLPPDGLTLEGTFLQDCRGGWCYRSCWRYEGWIDSAQVSYVGVDVWVNAQSGMVFWCDVVDWRPSHEGIISFQSAAAIALHHIDSSLGCVAEHGFLSQRFNSLGEARRFWVVHLRCDDSTGNGALHVDALRGQLVPAERYRACDFLPVEP